MNFTVDLLKDILKGEIINRGEKESISRIEHDSRKVDCNSLFVPLCGEKFDGHDFIKDAYDNGMRVTLCHKKTKIIPGVTYIKVADTTKSLGDIARYILNEKKPLKIAITGSVGKTTTKELVANVCGNIDKTLKTQGNFNNNIGLPFTVMRLSDEKITVLEMGMNHFNEISYLAGIVNPDIAIITNIGTSHMENLGSREGILKAKTEVLDHMEKGKHLILNGDDDMLITLKGKTDKNIIYFGIENKDCDILAYDIKEEEGKTLFKVQNKEYEINLTGKHNVYNALAAITAGRLAGGTYEEISKGISEFKSDGIRQNTVKKDGCTFIVDCYNASPDSMIAGLNVLDKTKGARKIAVLGSVAELGEKRDELLYQVGEKAKDYNVDMVLTVSLDALSINEGARSKGIYEKNFLTNKEVTEFLKENIKENDVVLIKGSRFYKMEEISEGLIK